MPQVALRLCVPLPATPGRVDLALGGADPCIITLPPLVADFDLRTLAMASMDAPLPSVDMEAHATYDHAVWRGLGKIHGGPWQAARRGDTRRALPHGDAIRLRYSPASHWGPARPAPTFKSVPYDIMDTRTRPGRGVPWGVGARLDAASGVPYQVMHRRPRVTTTGDWSEAVAMSNGRSCVWQERHRRPRPVELAAWRVADQVARRWFSAHQPAAPLRLAWLVPWGEGLDRYGWGGPWTPPPPPPPPYVGCYPPPRSADLPFVDWLATDRLTLNFYCRGSTRFVPRLRSYIVIHDIDVYSLSDSHPIHAARVALSLDADAWAWRFSATLLGRDALDAVMPDSGGAPVALGVEINGHVWHVLVEDWEEDRSHGRRGIQVSGRGLSAVLGVPSELPGSGTSATAMTLQQLVESHLPIGHGWTVDWTAPDWLVPAGAWSWHDLAPIQAMHAIAQGVGLVLVPAAAENRIVVQPRYPVLPWDFDAATPDLVIPDTAILRLARRQAIATQANAVYVHGGEVGGVLARVKRTGSAADRLAATQSHPIITHADAARALGSRILAGQHRQPEVRSVTTPLGGVWPLADLGQLLRVEADGTYDLGIINAVSIEATRAASQVSARQTLTLGEDTPNQWSAFRGLLPGDPLLAGTIAASHGDGTVTVDLVGGGGMRVRGTGSIGQAVYVRGGRVEGAAPALTAFDIDV